MEAVATAEGERALEAPLPPLPEIKEESDLMLLLLLLALLFARGRMWGGRCAGRCARASLEAFAAVSLSKRSMR